MLNYLKKFALEILPSVAATVIGAYIVNHYVNQAGDRRAGAQRPFRPPRAKPSRLDEPATSPSPASRPRASPSAP